MAAWYVYLLRCDDDTLYCGATTDPDRRLREHNAGTASKYTRARLPVTMVCRAGCEDKSQALKLEAAIKKMPRHRKLAHLNELAEIQPA